jgi:hypothetical protein
VKNNQYYENKTNSTKLKLYFGGNIMNYRANFVETVNMNEMVWYKGMLMTRKEAKEMRENGE